MTTDWNRIILDTQSPITVWEEIFGTLHDIASQSSSPIALHDATVVPDRLLAEAAWELWEAFPETATRTSGELIKWTGGRHPNAQEIQENSTDYDPPDNSKAVLILDALSLRELPILLRTADDRQIKPVSVKITGSECPSTTDYFAKALGLQSRSALANNTKPGTLALFEGDCYTDVVSMPFEDCAVPPSPNILIWHSWLDDLIHLHNKLPDQIAGIASKVLQGDGFWNFVNKLRQGRELVITSDHGYAVSKLFSSEVEDRDAIDILKKTFGASRNKTVSEPWQKRFMPPIVMAHNNQHVILGQRKWKVQGGFPHVCHGGMSLLEVAVPFVEFSAL